MTSIAVAVTDGGSKIIKMSKGKKRVRFDQDDETRKVKPCIREMTMPKSSLLTTEEKTLYWMQHEDHCATLQDVLTLTDICRQPESEISKDNDSDIRDSNRDANKVSFAQYAEALALTFTLCDAPPIITPEEEEDEDGGDPDAPSWNIRDSQSVGQLALWASHHTPTRGVESKILPGLNRERQLRRSRTIQGVLEAQKHLKNNPVALEETTSVLRAVSRACSHSAKQFAAALAVVDGTQAMLEYQRLGGSELARKNNEGRSDQQLQTKNPPTVECPSGKPLNVRHRSEADCLSAALAVRQRA